MSGAALLFGERDALGGCADGLAVGLDAPIGDLGLSMRPYNALREHGVETVGELLAMSDFDLLSLRNLGGASLVEIKAKLADRGLDRPGTVPMAPSTIPVAVEALVAEVVALRDRVRSQGEEIRALQGQVARLRRQGGEAT